MTNIQLFASADGKFTGFKAEGHSGYAFQGEDIVCAGISALIQTTVLGLEKIVHACLKIEAEKEKGLFLCMIAAENSGEKKDEADLLLRNMYLGLNELSKQYDKYLFVSLKEVE